MEEKLTLFKALRYIGFESTATRQISKGSVSVSLRIGYRSHWYVSTPYGELDYQSQGTALHGLVLYRLINKTDLEKMVELGYEPAKKELDSYEKTIARARKMITSEDLRAEEKQKIERQKQEFEEFQKREAQRKKLNAEVIELLKDKQIQKEKFSEREHKEKQLDELKRKLNFSQASFDLEKATMVITPSEITKSSDKDQKIVAEISELENQISRLPHKLFCHICGKKIADFNGLISHIHGLHKEEHTSLFNEAKKRLNLA